MKKDPSDYTAGETKYAARQQAVKAGKPNNNYRASKNMAGLLYGIGFSTGGKHKTQDSCKVTPAYKTWQDMLKRCYSTKFHETNSTYIGCAVSYEWHDFQNFAEWFYGHDYSDKGYQLDKDILFHGNKIYSPETCCFVPQQLNILLLDSAAARGEYPQGVCFNKSRCKFQAQLKINGKSKQLGRFNTSDEAYQVYKTAKERYVKNKAIEWANRIEWGVFKALMSWSLASENDI